VIFIADHLDDLLRYFKINNGDDTPDDTPEINNGGSVDPREDTPDDVFCICTLFSRLTRESSYSQCETPSYKIYAHFTVVIATGSLINGVIGNVHLHCINFHTFHIEFGNIRVIYLFTYYPANL